MKTKKLSPYQISGIAFLVVFLCAVVLGACLLLFGPLLPPFLPWADVSEIINTYSCPFAIGLAFLAYFIARIIQKNGEGKESVEAQAEAVMPKGNQEECLAIYVFNSDKISDEVSGAYGAYADGELLKALSMALEPDGGWKAIPLPLQACHGDLFERPMLAETPAVRVLSNWLNGGTYGMDATSLDTTMLRGLKSGQSLGYTPYAVGLGSIQKSYALYVHQELKARNVVGYMGLVTFDRAPFLSNIASELHLSVDMEIKGSKSSGWLASNKDLNEAGLQPS